MSKHGLAQGPALCLCWGGSEYQQGRKQNSVHLNLSSQRVCLALHGGAAGVRMVNHFQSCSSSLIYTCPTWAPTRPGDERGVWFPCEKLNNTFSWIWSLPTEEIFFSQSCQQKTRVLNSVYEQWACCINYPKVLVVVCQDYPSWFAWAWPAFLSVPPWALDSFCFKIWACLRPPWARKVAAASVSVIKIWEVE